MERDSFKEYSVLAMMSKEEQQLMKAFLDDSMQTYPSEYSTDTCITNIGLWPFSREHPTNLAVQQ